jgi:hypothetical protein
VLISGGDEAVGFVLLAGFEGFHPWLAPTRRVTG